MTEAVAAEAKYNARSPQTSLTASTLSASDSLSRSHLSDRHEARTHMARVALRTAPPREATSETVLRGERIAG